MQFHTQFRRIKPDGNWCVSCRIRHTNSCRVYGPMSQETRAKLAAAKKGQPGPMLGKKFSDAHRHNLSVAHKGQKSWNKGRHMVPPEARRLRERIHDCCSGMVRRVLKIKNEAKARKTFDYLGYTKSEFKAHIESLFRPGMCWENYGAWVVDHIKPVSAFVREGVTDVGVINALANLQPLWYEENLIKGDRYVPT
jgi:hypothetical protein